MNVDEVIARLRSMGSEHDRQGMGRFGINVERAFGISVYELRKLAREIGTDHDLALELWNSGFHEARILASFIADPAILSEETMEAWVADIDSWDLCDQTCSVFRKSPFAHRKVDEWCGREEEFVRRAGFVLIAQLAIHDREAPDDTFEAWFPLIIKWSGDERNFVRKAVNWALRNIGKRNPALNRQAIALAAQLRPSDDRTARWIGSNAHRELTSEKVQARLRR